MKKKLMMIAVLLGTLTLGSCVDDNESASVTEVREAKAEQLKAAAALDNARAQAELIKAEAEAALKAAEAAYKQACADSVAAKTAYETEKYMLELEKIRAEYEKLIAQYKQQAALYEKQLWDNAEAHVQTVYQKYLSALDEVNYLNGQIIDKKIEIAQAAIDEEKADAVLASQLYSLNKLIEAQNQRIAYYESLNVADKAELQKQLDALKAEAYNLINVEKPAAQKASTEAMETMADYRTSINPTLYFSDAHEEAAWEAGLLPYLKAWKQLNDLGWDANYNRITATETVRVEIDECPTTTDQIKYVLNESKAAQATWIAYFTEQKESEVEMAEETLGKPSEGKGDEAVAATGLYVGLEDAQAALKAAQDQLAAEKAKEAAAQDKDLIAQLEKDINGSLAIAVTAAEEAIAAQEEVIAEKEEMLKEFTDAVATVQDAEAVAAYDAAFETLKEYSQAYLKAKHELELIDEAIAEIGISTISDNSMSWGSGAYSELLALYQGTIDVEGVILSCKEQIARLEASIKGLSNVVSYEDKLALLEEQLANLETELEVQKALLAKYKAELDAALAE